VVTSAGLQTVANEAAQAADRRSGLAWPRRLKWLTLPIGKAGKAVLLGVRYLIPFFATFIESMRSLRGAST